MENLLFVYGTLLPGIPTRMAAYLSANCRPVGEANVKGRLVDLGHYPGLIYLSREKNRVWGFVFELPHPELTLSLLDQYEGIDPSHPETNEYRRERIPVEWIGTMLQAWAYLYNQPWENLREIPFERYIDYIDQNPDHQEFIHSG